MPRAVPAVTRALDILELFLGGAGPFSIPDVARRLRLPRSSAHELVQTLVSRGYLRPLERETGRFVLGLRLFELGSTYVANLDLAREGRELAGAVSAACNETVHLAVLDETQVVYIAKVDSRQEVRMVSAVGRRLPAHCTAVGKMLLAQLSERELTARYRRDRTLVAMTARSITSLDRLRRELTAVRARGLAFDNCESNTDVRCVAAPVYDRDGQVVAAMSISVPATRMGPRRRRELAALVQQGARQLSARLGYLGRNAAVARSASGG